MLRKAKGLLCTLFHIDPIKGGMVVQIKVWWQKWLLHKILLPGFCGAVQCAASERLFFHSKGWVIVIYIKMRAVFGLMMQRCLNGN